MARRVQVKSSGNACESPQNFGAQLVFAMNTLNFTDVVTFNHYRSEDIHERDIGCVGENKRQK